MPIEMPDGKRTVVAMTIDFDAHSPWMGMNKTSPSILSRGEFGADVGVPRLLRLFEQLEIATTWFAPGHDLVTFPHRIEQVLSGGHEIAAHGCFHENIPSLEPDEERRLMEVQLAQHLSITGMRPRGYRSPAWDFSDITMSLLEQHGFEWDSSLMGREFEPYYPRPVTVNYESANVFGQPSSVLEFPVSWYLDDWPAVEYVPGQSSHMGSHETMLARWKDIFDYAHERTEGSIYTLTVHPQTTGRAHHIAGLERLLTDFRGRDDVWFASLSQIFDAWVPEHGE
jgi:peptidoglycan/xylan/chitin deacetylase (PgdA/CDA1 family)